MKQRAAAETSKAPEGPWPKSQGRQALAGRGHAFISLEAKLAACEGFVCFSHTQDEVTCVHTQTNACSHGLFPAKNSKQARPMGVCNTYKEWCVQRLFEFALVRT